MRIATVKYLNALPFLYALKELQHKNLITLIEATPAHCSELLHRHEVDIALIPVGSLSDFNELYFVSDYCISCDGPVRTVKLFSNYPIEQIEQIILDSSSRSSNLLIQILCKDYWKRNDIKFSSRDEQVNELKTAFVKIGDKVFQIENQYDYEYDLGVEWKSFTALPFVFAVWVSSIKLVDKDLIMLNDCFKSKLQNISDIIKDDDSLKGVNIDGYFEKNIYYELNTEKKSGLKRFLELAGLKNPLLEFQDDSTVLNRL